MKLWSIYRLFQNYDCPLNMQQTIPIEIWALVVDYLYIHNDWQVDDNLVNLFKALFGFNQSAMNFKITQQHSDEEPELGISLIVNHLNKNIKRNIVDCLYLLPQRRGLWIFLHELDDDIREQLSIDFTNYRHAYPNNLSIFGYLEKETYKRLELRVRNGTIFCDMLNHYYNYNNDTNSEKFGVNNIDDVAIL